MILNYRCGKDNLCFAAGYSRFAKDCPFHLSPLRGDKTAVRKMAKQSAAIKVFAQRFSIGYLTLSKYNNSISSVMSKPKLPGKFLLNFFRDHHNQDHSQLQICLGLKIQDNQP